MALVFITAETKTPSNLAPNRDKGQHIAGHGHVDSGTIYAKWRSSMWARRTIIRAHQRRVILMLPEIIEDVLGKVLQPGENFPVKSKR